VTELGAILLFGLLMAAIALVGSVTTLLDPRTLERWLLPLVAFAAGSLLGGAVFHMMPAAIERSGNTTAVWLWLSLGFLAFFCLEQFLDWHHCHAAEHHHEQPLNWLILFADGLHNLLGGLSIGAVFVADFRLGVTAWLAAAAHEIPQELGDFGVLVHGGWSRRRALVYNLFSALTFPLGMLVAWGASGRVDVDWLIPFGAGNFLYIGCADLIPEVKGGRTRHRAVLHLVFFVSGLLLLLALRVLFGHGSEGG
jgi:zinc and cadmium transporter